MKPAAYRQQQGVQGRPFPLKQIEVVLTKDLVCQLGLVDRDEHFEVAGECEVTQAFGER